MVYYYFNFFNHMIDGDRMGMPRGYYLMSLCQSDDSDVELFNQHGRSMNSGTLISFLDSYGSIPGVIPVISVSNCLYLAVMAVHCLPSVS